MVKLAEPWERTSARGSRYSSGFMGDAQVLLFDGGEKPHPTKPGETVHVWRLMVQERDPSRRPERRPQSPDLGDAAKPSARQQRPESVTARSPARHQGQGEGWRGSHRRPASGAWRGATADGGAFYDDDLTDIGR